MSAASGSDPAVAPVGSVHHLVLLYWPAATRAAAEALLRTRAEIRASLRPALDHSVAHTRLTWWQDELARALHGAAAHPLTRQLQQALRHDPAGPPDLTSLAHSVALELARVPFQQSALRRTWCDGDTGTLFAIGARLLNATPRQPWARALGAQLQDLEWLARQSAGGDEQAVASAHLRELIGELPPREQPPLRPLLVWTRLALQRTTQRNALPPDAVDVSLWRGIAQNIAAWSAARAADRGRWQLFP